MVVTSFEGKRCMVLEMKEWTKSFVYVYMWSHVMWRSVTWEQLNFLPLRSKQACYLMICANSLLTSQQINNDKFFMFFFSKYDFCVVCEGFSKRKKSYWPQVHVLDRIHINKRKRNVRNGGWKVNTVHHVTVYTCTFKSFMDINWLDFFLLLNYNAECIWILTEC